MMAKLAIVYASVHHGNTEKLLRGMVQNGEADLFDLTKNSSPDVSEYEAVGYASGIYAMKMHKLIYQFLDSGAKLPKKAVAICTSGVGKGTLVRRFSKVLTERGFDVIGEFECKGFDTFGPLRFFGGINKEHPNEEDIRRGKAFLQGVMEKLEVRHDTTE